MNLNDVSVVSGADPEAPNEAYLGRIMWYSVADTMVPHDRLVPMLLTFGFGQLPSIPLDVDTFRRVTTAGEQKKIPTPTVGVLENYLLRETNGIGGDEVRKRIVIESVDPKGRRLGYSQVLDVSFDREKATIKFEAPDNADPMESWQQANVDMIKAGILARYERERGCVTAYTLREWIRKQVLRMGGTNLRPESGGVYFVKEEHAEIVGRLEKLADRIRKGDGTEPYGDVWVHTLPLVDDAKQRQMIRRAYEAEAVDAAEKIINRIQQMDDARASGKSSRNASDQFLSIVNDYQELKEKTKEYETILADTMQHAQSNLRLVQKKLVRLRGHMDS